MPRAHTQAMQHHLDEIARTLAQRRMRSSCSTRPAGIRPTSCACRKKLDDTLYLTDTAAEMLADARTGRNDRHRLAGFLRQSVFGGLAGYEDVNDSIVFIAATFSCSYWTPALGAEKI